MDPDEHGTDGRWRPARLALIALVAAVLLVILFTWVFPWIERNLANPTIGLV